MVDEGIPPEVKRLITDHIRSVVQLEALLLLWKDPAREWLASDLSRELRIDAAWVDNHLGDLCTCGILTCTDASPRTYRYNPQTVELDRAVAGLATAYADRRVTVISMIFSKPTDSIRSFADAFRLRKDRSDG